MMSQPCLNLGYLGTKTKSVGHIIEKHCILLFLGVAYFSLNISQTWKVVTYVWCRLSLNLYHLASKHRSQVQMIEKHCLPSCGSNSVLEHNQHLQANNAFCLLTWRRLCSFLSSTIQSIWRAVLLTPASASASSLLIKVLVQLHIFYCNFNILHGIHLKLQIYVPYHHSHHMG